MNKNCTSDALVFVARKDSCRIFVDTLGKAMNTIIAHLLTLVVLAESL